MNISNKRHFLTVKDYSVSQETFSLYHDEVMDMLITHPQPNADNLAKYYQSEDYISHTDHKRTLFEHAYHIVKRFTLQSKLKLVNRLQAQRGRILDIGMGTGDFLLVCKNDGWEVTGVEPSIRAKEIALKKNVQAVESTAALESRSFDVICMWHVLEHVLDLDAQLKELRRLLKPSGTLIVAVPNFKSYDAQHYKQFWAAFDVPIHFWHFSKTAISKLFQKQEMSVIKVLPMKWDSFYVSLLSEKYMNGTINYFSACFIGFLSNLKAKRSSEYSSHIYIIENTNRLF